MIVRQLNGSLIVKYLSHKARVFVAALASLLVSVVAPLAIAQLDDYTLNAGDSIRIYAYGEPDLTFEKLLIGQRGRISFPFLGELEVEGLSVNDVQNLLTAGLKPDYLVDPRVSVSIVEYRPFFVNGEVKNPGAVDFQPGLTLRKAITLAGGFTARANKKEMLVIADNAAGEEGERVDLDYRIRPGDIITVKDTFF
ncbi:polysaccharide biosynthesis/export family protein [Congregibacter variabilis]|uniref:Polysaccharide biosynthesis/export family protein n=1 Tax=Congregibacter variabilis TaxID=3081200 RepID=A0ABZ0I6A1_9GAMM|nr:polysaccharide biosynthesis/export family protein [Congregibacter sp. IMCC43200]